MLATSTLASAPVKLSVSAARRACDVSSTATVTLPAPNSVSIAVCRLAFSTWSIALYAMAGL
jgi:hypothetical protein